MAYSVHLFKLAKLNSEIKYVANSVVREAPKYAYPTIIDIIEWQNGMRQQLDQWAADITTVDDSLAASHMVLVCQLRYHSVRMLLLRPSPAVPKPSAEAFSCCYASAQAGIQIFYELYKKNLLIHSWLSFHSLVLSVLTMLYCIKASPDVARQIEVDTLMGDLSIGLSLLSATGEHWSGAKRIRDILDDLGRSIFNWLRETNHSRRNENEGRIQGTTIPMQTSSINETLSMAPSEHVSKSYMPGIANEGALDLAQPLDDSFSGFGLFNDFIDIGDSENLDVIMRDLFQGLIPDYASLP
jgi:hypothetical protein